jgi:hypothetical protein
MHECKHPLAPSIFWSSRKSSTQSFPTQHSQSRVRPVMEITARSFSNVPALIKQAVWGARLAFPDLLDV